MLDHRTRTLTLCASALCIAAAFAATPQQARSAGDPTPQAVSPPAAIATEAPIAAVVPKRDPFIGENAEPEPARTNLAAPTIPIGAPLPLLPPNAGAGRNALLDSPAAIVLRAIVNGERPCALVEENGATRVVSVGERVGGSPILTIDRETITLADGRTFSLSTTSRAAPEKS